MTIEEVLKVLAPAAKRSRKPHAKGHKGKKAAAVSQPRSPAKRTERERKPPFSEESINDVPEM